MARLSHLAFASPRPGPIALGADLRQGLFFQEFWQAGRPFYAVANQTPRALKLEVWPGLEAGPGQPKATWSVGPRDTTLIDARALATQSAGFLSLSLENRQPWARVKAPTLAPGWLTVSDPRAYFSVEGMNGIGDRSAGVVFTCRELEYKSYSRFDAQLYLPAGFGTLRLEPTDVPVPALEIENAESSTLAIKFTQHGVLVKAQGDFGAEGGHTLSLSLRVPIVSDSTFAVLAGRFEQGPERSQPLLRALIAKA